MNLDSIVQSVFNDLDQVAMANPNERLPKEEQIRSRIYSTLLCPERTVCCEHGYTPVGQDNEIECDIYTHSNGKPSGWIEIKRCWSGSFGWVTKPAEQLRSWTRDLEKLKTVPICDARYFFLFGVFDFEPIGFSGTKIPGVIRNIRSFYPENLQHKSSRNFRWRGEDISHIGAWIWSWQPGEILELPKQA